MSVCFMMGHAHAEDRLLPQILDMAQYLVAHEGVTQFLVGHYGAFDRLAAQAVRQLKRTYSNVELILLLPYYSPATDLAGGRENLSHFLVPFPKNSFILGRNVL